MEVENAFGVAHSLLRKREVRSALAAFNAAQKLGHPQDECCAGRWQCWMLLGEFERAWQESDQISASGAKDPQGFWDGRSWANQRVMLRCLHGLGDTIQFIRYAPLLKQSCAKLTVQTHPELVSLLETLPSVDQVVTWSAAGAEYGESWDMQMEVNELPRAFRTVLKTIPATCPYFLVPEERLSWASKWFENNNGQPRIGVCWRAGPWDPNRSLEISDLAPLLGVPGASFVSLQKASESGLVAHFPQVIEAAVHATDVLDTAAIISQLDLVVTVDTMIAHLTGALGKQVWIMLPTVSDWRWMMGIATCPWYPTARLFRQSDGEGWSKPVSEIMAALLTL